jgi:hypothetical protein
LGQLVLRAARLRAGVTPRSEKGLRKRPLFHEECFLTRK